MAVLLPTLFHKGFFFVELELVYFSRWHKPILLQEPFLMYSFSINFPVNLHVIWWKPIVVRRFHVGEVNQWVAIIVKFPGLPLTRRTFVKANCPTELKIGELELVLTVLWKGPVKIEV